ncbi:MAG: tetratricopeptide repeat protein, partial [Candidatus Zixiibacteriota bacterium]
MANKFYQDKDYNSAIRLYNSILNRGIESAPLYFNLGNAYFKQGNLGYAVLNFMKAKRLDPEDEDILNNLNFVRQFSAIQMEGVELNPIKTFLVSIVDRYHLNKIAWMASIFFILFFGFLSVRYGLGIIHPVVRTGIIISLTLLIISTGLTSFKYRYDYLTRRAVIIAEDSPVFTGPSEQSGLELEG